MCICWCFESFPYIHCNLLEFFDAFQHWIFLVLLFRYLYRHLLTHSKVFKYFIPLTVCNNSSCLLQFVLLFYFFIVYYLELMINEMIFEYKGMYVFNLSIYFLAILSFLCIYFYHIYVFMMTLLAFQNFLFAVQCSFYHS